MAFSPGQKVHGPSFTHYEKLSQHKRQDAFAMSHTPTAHLHFKGQRKENPSSSKSKYQVLR